MPPLPKGEALKKVAAIDNARPYIIMRETTGLHYGLKEATGAWFTRTLCTRFPARVVNFGEKRLYKFLKKAAKGACNGCNLRKICYNMGITSIGGNYDQYVLQISVVGMHP